MYTSRSLDELLPHVRKKALDLALACQDEGITLLVYCTYRDVAAQDALYAQGRTKPGHVVTNARGGESNHQKRIAFDAIPMLHGKPQWANDALIDRVGALAEKVGLQWAGNWQGKLRERCHFEG